MNTIASAVANPRLAIQKPCLKTIHRATFSASNNTERTSRQKLYRTLFPEEPTQWYLLLANFAKATLGALTLFTIGGALGDGSLAENLNSISWETSIGENLSAIGRLIPYAYCSTVGLHGTYRFLKGVFLLKKSDLNNQKEVKRLEQYFRKLDEDFPGALQALKDIKMFHDSGKLDSQKRSDLLERLWNLVATKYPPQAPQKTDDKE